jgi:hypothetical protein
VDDQGRDEHGGRQREHPFPQRLIVGALKQHRRDDAEHNRDTNAPMHRGNQLLAARLPQIGQGDRHDQERLEPFTQRDAECLQHGTLLN